jgi:DNA-binding Xre family transcriptional regulator
MTNPKPTQTKLRFRIKMLLAERDMTVADLYQRVKQQGFDISSSHFFRQMQPYPNAVRPDLLVTICRALGCEASELFDLVEVTTEAEEKKSKPKAVSAMPTAPKPTDARMESDEISAAKRKAEEKRKVALLGPKVAVLGIKKGK